jgi:hypothetical protein
MAQLMILAKPFDRILNMQMRLLIVESRVITDVIMRRL